MRTRTLRLVVVGFYLLLLVYLGVSIAIPNTSLGLKAGEIPNGWWLIMITVLLPIPMFIVIAAQKRQRKIESQKIAGTQ